MLDFLYIKTKYSRNNGLEIYPDFHVEKSKDLMIRGQEFYAIYNEDTGFWSKDIYEAYKIIDKEMDKYKEEHKHLADAKVMYLRDSSSGYVDKFLHYVKKQLIGDNFHVLDQNLIFSNQVVTKESYATHKLSYPLEEGCIDTWNEIIGTLYSPDERHKIEWCIGAIVSGDSKTLQKFLVLYGPRGTGKSTIIDIIQMLFKGYHAPFDAQALGSANREFATEPLRTNPLVAIQHDGKLDRIEDNTRLNSIVSHEMMTANEKYTKAYPTRFNSFLIIGTNEPVKITNAKSGLLRRLIDVSPSGKKIPTKRYFELKEKVEFELSGIAWHCLQVYKENPRYYDDYVPEKMMGESNDFYNFVSDYYESFKNSDGTTATKAWEWYKKYTQDANIPHPMSYIKFKAELKNYFNNYEEIHKIDEDKTVRGYYTGFRVDIFNPFTKPKKEVVKKYEGWIKLDAEHSLFDVEYSDCPAQYANDEGKPRYKWDNVDTELRHLDTRELHYVRVPENMIVIDFDIKDENGEKSLEKNLEAANKFPKTYAELSQSGKGVHLHYIYTGNVNELSRVYADNIEVKAFTGKSTLRRKLTECNDIPIATISSGLPLKEVGKKVINSTAIKNEKKLREMILKNLNKEYMQYTTPSINFIFKILEDAYEQPDFSYDVRDMSQALINFANNSSNQADKCLAKVLEMHLCSKDYENPELYSSMPKPETEEYSEKPITIFDCEVFPNLFVVCAETLDGKEIDFINPTPEEIEWLVTNHRLVGYNNLRYDNPIMHHRIMGYTNEMLFKLSKSIIANIFKDFVSSKYISYTDIFDFVSDKKSLKKYEVEYGIHHQELGLDWNKPVPKELWPKVVKYCKNDVKATKVVWEKRHGDFIAREILADLTGMTVNDTTNQLTTRLIFGDNTHPQDEFNYVHLGGNEDSKVEHISEVVSHVTGNRYSVDPEFTCIDTTTGQMVFPGYDFGWVRKGTKDTFVALSTYRGVKVGEGGYVFADAGMYWGVTTKDITSMHPHSIKAMNLFGNRYTKIFYDLVLARVAIKHGIKTGDFSEVGKIFDGRLMKYLDDPKQAKMLSNALKIAINSVYGLTAAKFPNRFRDERNEDNIVAKRGALFMINLYHEVINHGWHVVHIKTDSIKIENMTPEIEDFVCAYGALYGYSFETEHVFDRICLVNDAVYIGKCADNDPESPGKWEATGEQFAVPYVFKTLFSHEEIGFNDLFEVFSVSTALYLDMNENLPDDKQLIKEKNKIVKSDPTNVDRLAELDAEIAKCHNYIFIGRTGAFCPIKKGCGGGRLVRLNENTGAFGKATGTKDFRWLENEVVLQQHKEEDIDRKYYTDLVDEAVAAISEFGDFEAFTA